MKPNNLKESIKGALARDLFDGVQKWSKKSIHGVINPAGYKNSLTDPEIINMLKELEAEGYIKLIYGDDIYLEILEIANRSKR